MVRSLFEALATVFVISVLAGAGCGNKIGAGSGTGAGGGTNSGGATATGGYGGASGGAAGADAGGAAGASTQLSVEAGADVTIALPTRTVTLHGTATAKDGSTPSVA